MNRAQFYIFRQVGISTVFIVVTLTAVIWLTQAMRFIRFILNKGLSVDVFFYITSLLLPSFLLITLPVSMFFATLFTLNKMTNDRELVVLRSSGMSHWQAAKPVLALSLIGMAMCYSISLYLLPVSIQEFRRVQTAIRENFSAALLLEGTFNTVSKDLTIYVRSREGNEIHGILVQDSRKPDAPTTIMAKRGAVEKGPDGPRVILFDGNRQELERKTGRLSILYFKQYSFEVNVFGENRAEWREPAERFLGELFDPGNSANDRFYRTKLIAEGHNRLSAPLLALTLPFIALFILLPGQFNKRGQLPRLLTAIVIASAVQGVAVAVLQLASKSLAFVPLMYLNAIVPMAIGAWILTPRARPRPRRLVPAAH
ncbi:MAG: LPS export ABC transporter permease LptF [Rhodospirillaceae bacterium]|nr:LPS export ABC transporter permease LptF [Rhodospirillaceae bacterium]